MQYSILGSSDDCLGFLITQLLLCTALAPETQRHSQAPCDFPPSQPVPPPQNSQRLIPNISYCDRNNNKQTEDLKFPKNFLREHTPNPPPPRGIVLHTLCYQGCRQGGGARGAEAICIHTLNSIPAPPLLQTCLHPWLPMIYYFPPPTKNPV